MEIDGSQFGKQRTINKLQERRVSKIYVHNQDGDSAQQAETGVVLAPIGGTDLGAHAVETL